MSHDHAKGIGKSPTAPELLIGISFDDVLRAEEFLTAAKRLALAHTFVLHDAVLVVKDHAGNAHVRETIDPQPGRTALTGAMWTGLLGLVFAGPVGWIAGVALGAGVGAGAAKLIDLGITDAWVAWFKEAVDRDTATIVLLVSDVDRDALVTEVRRFTGAELVYADFDEDTMRRLAAALETSSSPV